MHTAIDVAGFDLRQRLQFALGDEAPVRLDQHEAPVALDAIEVDGNRLTGDGAAAFQRMNVETGHLHGQFLHVQK
ncbi:hypothetical protein D9M70_603420 [compost metagenome]